jgi:hypothetical protein
MIYIAMTLVLKYVQRAGLEKLRPSLSSRMGYGYEQPWPFMILFKFFVDSTMLEYMF